MSRNSYPWVLWRLSPISHPQLLSDSLNKIPWGLSHTQLLWGGPAGYKDASSGFAWNGVRAGVSRGGTFGGAVRGQPRFPPQEVSGLFGAGDSPKWEENVFSGTSNYPVPAPGQEGCACPTPMKLPSQGGVFPLSCPRAGKVPLRPPEWGESPLRTLHEARPSSDLRAGPCTRPRAPQARAAPSIFFPGELPRLDLSGHRWPSGPGTVRDRRIVKFYSFVFFFFCFPFLFCFVLVPLHKDLGASQVAQW